VSPFLRNAHEIFATARQNAGDCSVAILVAPDGTLRICPSAGWDLECLRLHHGAAAVYGVTRRGSQVRVEARSPSGQCTLADSGAPPPHGLGIGNFPQYCLIP
jgi:hypothetical protein